MNKEINKIDAKILILIVLLLPFNQIMLNYLFKIRFFVPLAHLTDYWIQPTLVANLLSLIVFSILIFVIGKHNLFSVWFTEEKLKIALLPVFVIWLLSQIITIAGTYYSKGELSFIGNINTLAGNLIGQLFGNAAFEELIYRGILFLQFYILLTHRITKKKALVISIVVSQILFALIHIPNRLLINQVDNLSLDLIGLFLAGVVLTIIYIRSENLVFVIGIHALINQPFNIIDTTFPMNMSIYIFIILTILLWNKIVPTTPARFLNNSEPEMAKEKF